VLYDVFISHASEDKNDFVRPLAEALQAENVEVWYDEFSMVVGDSLRQSIDKGQAQSRFGIVVLSPSFFDKGWTEWELNGLVARQNSGEARVILPIWHNVSRDDVLAYSPPLVDINALNSVLTIPELVAKLVRAIHPTGSTLIEARAELLAWKQPAPVVTDDWWLDVVAFAERNDLEGTFQEPMGWGRWGFPLPRKSADASARGLRVAWAAMQMTWMEDADAGMIAQITPPKDVLAFVEAHPPLSYLCGSDRFHLRYLLAYAPQLAIRGFGGDFEEAIEEYYESTKEPSRADPTKLTCADDVAIRGFADGCEVSWSLIACNFVQGDINGPSVTTFESFDYIPWLLSDMSSWMPPEVRHRLLEGIGEWGVWPWVGLRVPRIGTDFVFEEKDFTGAFVRALHQAKSLDSLEIVGPARGDLQDRIQISVDLLGLPETPDELLDALLRSPILDAYFRRSQAD
jgi:hypothetical protein